MKTQDLLIAVGLVGLAIYLMKEKSSGDPRIVGSDAWLNETAKRAATGDFSDQKAGTGYYLLRDEYRQ